MCVYKIIGFTQDYSKLKGKNCKKTNVGKELRKMFSEK